MKKLLFLIPLFVFLVGCEKENTTQSSSNQEKVKYAEGYCIAWYLAVKPRNAWIEFNSQWNPYSSKKEPIGTFIKETLDVDSLVFIENNGHYTLHMVKTLAIFAKTHDENGNTIPRDTLFYWYSSPDKWHIVNQYHFKSDLKNHNKEYNSCFGNESLDVIKSSSGYRKAVTYSKSEYEYYVEKLGYCHTEGKLDEKYRDEYLLATTVKDTIIDISCPHEIDEEFYLKYKEYSDNSRKYLYDCYWRAYHSGFEIIGY